jgi:hypothetical protein
MFPKKPNVVCRVYNCLQGEIQRPPKIGYFHDVPEKLGNLQDVEHRWYRQM